MSGRIDPALDSSSSNISNAIVEGLTRSIHNLNISPIKSGSLKCLNTKNFIISSANEYPTCQAWNAELGAFAKLSNIIRRSQIVMHWIEVAVLVFWKLFPLRGSKSLKLHINWWISRSWDILDYLGTPTRFSAADWYATGYARKRWSTPSWPNKAKLRATRFRRPASNDFFKKECHVPHLFLSACLILRFIAPFLVNPIWW